MVDGSGLRTAPAVRIKSPGRSHFHFLILLATLTSNSACVYFNSYYNAHELFKQGRRDVAEGRESSGRASLAASIEKAERIVARSPDSRWADDAIRLIVRARLLREEWQEAVAMSQNLLRYARARRDTAEVAGYMGIARLNLGQPAAADSLLSFALTEELDDAERALLLQQRALAQAALGRLAGAYEDLLFVSRLRPDWVQPRIDRVKLLVADGRADDAALELRGVWPFKLLDSEERAVVEAVRSVVETNPETAYRGLTFVETSTLKRDNRALLVRLRADLHLARGEVDQALADYRLAARIAPESQTGPDAQLAATRLALTRAAAPGELVRVRAALEQLIRRPQGRGTEVMQLWESLVRVEYWVGLGGLAYLLAAETARDELGAPLLARRLFLRYADEDPESRWAPKALLAALELSDLDSAALAGEPGAAELRRRLWVDYPGSPYLRAILGGRPSDDLTYEALELGLRRQLEELGKLADQEVVARRASASR